MYKEFLEDKCIYDANEKYQNGFLVNYENQTESTINLVLKFRPGYLSELRVNLDKFDTMD